MMRFLPLFLALWFGGCATQPVYRSTFHETALRWYSGSVEQAFAEAESPLVEDWTPEGLRTEVMLLEGFPLDSRVEPVKELKKNQVERIGHEWHAHRLLVCLDKQVHADTIKGLELEDGDIFICLDTAIDDQSKLRLSDKGMIKTI